MSPASCKASISKSTKKGIERPVRNLQKLRANKDGNINKSLFNFLENLLVFRTMEELAVPSESGVKFRITRQENEPGICLLIHIDNQLFPVIEEGVPRPDYLAVYLHGNGCLCTIIDMKGRDQKRLEHGVIQIKELADTLKQEFTKHLPSNFRLHIQGILLCPFNAQVPNNLIREMSNSGLTILPAQCNDRAELYPYISKKNELKNRFQSNQRHPTSLSPIETMLSQRALKSRISDELTIKRGGEGLGDGLHINYGLSDSEYATLITRGKKCVFVVKEHGKKCLEEIRADIDVNGLGHKFDVVPMPENEE